MKKLILIFILLATLTADAAEVPKAGHCYYLAAGNMKVLKLHERGFTFGLWHENQYKQEYYMTYKTYEEFNVHPADCLDKVWPDEEK